jgi:CDP-glycerol glycerophosphotransferase
LLRIIKSLINLIFGDIIFLLSCIIPKNDNIWIFGSWGGEKYSDNSKYLFEYVNKNHPEIRSIWIVKNKKIRKILENKNYEVYGKNSLKAILISLRAGVFIVTVNVARDLNIYPSKNAKIVQLWHGTPLKKILIDVKPPSQKIKLLKFLFPYLNENISILTAASSEVKKKYITAFGIDPERIKITGYPRNDGLHSPKKITTDDKKGIYLPTFRKEYNYNIFQYNFNFQKVENSLKNMGVHIYIQLHPLDDPDNKFRRLLSSSKFIHIVEFDDVYSILNDFDFLITDFSSVYFDYLLLEKPIIFAPFDLETYLSEERELYYDYYSITPGPKAKDWNELLDEIEESLRKPEKYLNDIKRVKNLFNKYDDCKNCQRVFNEIKNIL